MVIRSVLSSMLMIFLMVIPGVIFRRGRMITEEQGDAVNSIIVNLTWPCLVIDAMQMEFSMDILKKSGCIFIICMIVFILLLLLSVPLAPVSEIFQTKAISHSLYVTIWQYRIYRNSCGKGFVWRNSCIFHGHCRDGQ